jgi:hypothetical protein
MALSATEKLCRKKKEKKVRLESDFAGIKAGQMMFVATPMIVDAYIRAIPMGQHRTVPGMRNELARRNKCDASCPVSTAIFVRMSADAAIEQMEAGKPAEEVTPFWRILRPTDKIATRLKIDPDWIESQRKLEGLRD